MKRASIISKQGKPELAKVAREVTGWLRTHGYSVTVDAAAREFCPECELADREEVVAKGPDFVVVLGGDGTLLPPRATWPPPAFPFLASIWDRSAS